MNNTPENMQSPERNPDNSVNIEPEIFAKLSIYVDMLKSSNVSEAEMYLDYGISEFTVEGVVNAALRDHVAGIESTLHGDPSDFNE